MLFILGVERSATTWVSNLLEAHPSTRVYVEPMSKFTTRFRDWPVRFDIITDLEAKADYFQNEFDVIRQRRHWLLTRYLETPSAWKFDLWLSRFLVRKKLSTESIQDFYQINFHRKSQLKIKKQRKIELEVIKELRLNFNARIISHINPNARVLVVVRDLAANIQSILTHIEQKNLVELRQLLLNYYGGVNEESVFKYWRDSYNSLLQQLEQTNTPHLVLNHNDLITDSSQWIRSICEFIDLENPKWIVNYVYQSNEQGAGLHNTNRNHEELLKRNHKARQEVLPKLEGIIQYYELHPKLRRVAFE